MTHQVSLQPVAPLPSSLSPGNYGSPGWEVRRCVARHSSWTRSDTPGGQDRNRNSLAGGDTSVNILASHLPGEQQLPSCPGPHGWWVSAGCYSGVMPADSERLAVVLAWWAITCISAHSAFAAGTWFRAPVRVGQRRLLVGACVLRVTRHECRTSLLMNMDRSYEADRNPSAMVTVTLSCSP